MTAPLAGWLTTLAAVPDAVFADRMLGEGVAIDPIGDILHAPCDAVLLSIHAARHALTLRAANGAELLIHLGIDTVGLAGAGITPLVEPGAKVRRGDPLLSFDLDALVCGARAVVTPVILTDLDRFAVEVVAGEGMVAVGDPLFRVVARVGAQDASFPREGGGPGATSGVLYNPGLPRSRENGDIRRDVTVMLAHGIHARPAAALSAAVRDMAATVTLVHGDRRATTTSVVALLGLGVPHGAVVGIEAQGADAATAVDAVARLLLDDTPEPVAAPRAPSASPTIDAPGLRGVAAAPGLAIGPARWLRAEDIVVPEHGAGIDVELRALDVAVAFVRVDLTIGGSATGTKGAVIAAHAALLDDPALLDAARGHIRAGRSAAAAYRDAVDAQAATLRASGDARIAERADDLRDIEHRVLRAILGLPDDALRIAPGGILLARELLPSQVIALDPAAVAGIVLAEGGPTSHVAILAAGMGLPMAVAFGDALNDVAEGAMLVLDADCGMLAVDPPEAELVQARAAVARRSAEEAAARATGGVLCHSADGRRVEIFANLGSVADARTAVCEGAEGCGLLRTEFLFLDRTDPPGVAEQAADYQAIGDVLGDRQLIVRLLDVGGDKPAPYLSIAPEENPALGLRGIRVALARPEILDAQLRAILSVVPQGRCRIMVPMVASVAELDAVKAAVERLRDTLGIAAPIAVGAMVETPAAALCADLLASRAAFLSIGSNDLTQYALAMDRGNPAVAAGIDGLHPAVLRLIAATCDGAGGHDCPVGVCGGLAADPLAVPILLGLGVTELSVPPARIAATKALVARLSLPACRLHAAAVIGLSSAQAVRAQAVAFAQEAL